MSTAAGQQDSASPGGDDSYSTQNNNDLTRLLLNSLGSGVSHPSGSSETLAGLGGSLPLRTSVANQSQATTALLLAQPQTPAVALNSLNIPQTSIFGSQFAQLPPQLVPQASLLQPNLGQMLAAPNTVMAMNPSISQMVPLVSGITQSVAMVPNAADPAQLLSLVHGWMPASINPSAQALSNGGALQLGGPNVGSLGADGGAMTQLLQNLLSNNAASAAGGLSGVFPGASALAGTRGLWSQVPATGNPAALLQGYGPSILSRLAVQGVAVQAPSPGSMADRIKQTAGSNFTELEVFRIKNKELRNKPFPVKLHRLLKDVADQGLEDIISWCPSGRAFKVHDRDRFVAEIMPRYFRMSKTSSYRRQLSMYGFTRIHKGPEQGAYMHKLFLKEQPELAKEIYRTPEQQLIAEAKKALEEEEEAARARSDGEDNGENEDDRNHED